jgi:hypothetical protein
MARINFSAVDTHPRHGCVLQRSKSLTGNLRVRTKLNQIAHVIRPSMAKATYLFGQSLTQQSSPPWSTHATVQFDNDAACVDVCAFLVCRIRCPRRNGLMRSTYLTFSAFPPPSSSSSLPCRFELFWTRRLRFKTYSRIMPWRKFWSNIPQAYAAARWGQGRLWVPIASRWWEDVEPKDE